MPESRLVAQRPAHSPAFVVRDIAHRRRWASAKLDPAGFSLVQSPTKDLPFRGLIFRDDFQLRTDVEQPNVRRTYAGVV